MNGLRCPKCNLVNLTTAAECHRCGTSFSNLPPTVFVSVPVEETFHARRFAAQNPMPLDTELGRKTFFWYRVYCGFMVGLYALVAAGGALMFFLGPEINNVREAQETIITGVVYGVLGVVFGIIYLIALFLPARSWNWIVGIVMIGLGMTSCCFLPALVPLLIFWLKPETQAFFGRK